MLLGFLALTFTIMWSTKASNNINAAGISTRFYLAAQFYMDIGIVKPKVCIFNYPSHLLSTLQK